MVANFYFTPNDRLEFNKEFSIVYTNQPIAYKEDTTLEQPTFIFRADKWDDDVNYIYVSAPVDRFYFVDDVTFSKQYIEIKCSEDYLQSHKQEILELDGIVERVSTKARWNLYLQDDKLKTFNMTRFCTIPWPGSFRVNDSKTYSYILTLSGGGSNGNNNP